LTSTIKLTSIADVLRCIARIAVIFALCCAIGLHWIALQSVAWSAMLVQYAKHAPLRQAITQTFDGAHPCSICHIVNTGKASERKSDLQSPAPKIDIICVSRTMRLIPLFSLFEYATRDFSVRQIGKSPPVPPPRLLPG
jgi:hypothetical protein